jgi:ABC-type glycerol-3-phosphate transport system permease component
MREPAWFRCARAIVLTLLGLFAVVPVYVMLTASLKPLQDVEGAFRWIPSHLTLSPFVGLQGYATQNQVYWNQIMAASLTVSVPIVVGFLLLQRYLVAGMTAGSVK